MGNHLGFKVTKNKLTYVWPGGVVKRYRLRLRPSYVSVMTSITARIFNKKRVKVIN
jgi:hypothetical protein